MIGSLSSICSRTFLDPKNQPPLKSAKQVLDRLYLLASFYLTIFVRTFLSTPIVSTDTIRTYLNLKNRNRYFIMIFIRQFRDTLAELKEVVEQELEEGGRGTGAVSS